MMEVDTHADTLVEVNGNGTPHANGDAESNGAHKEPKFASGLILPPPEIKCECCIAIEVCLWACLTRNVIAAVIDRTAAFVARSANPPLFEDKIRENQRQDPKFSFLNPADPYHAYYRHRMDKVVRGEVEDEVVPEKGETPKEVEPVKEVDLGVEPPQPEFILDAASISSMDL